MAKRTRASDAVVDEQEVEQPEATTQEPVQEPEAPQEEPVSGAATVAKISGKTSALGSKARAMREFLAKQPKVRIFVPLAPGEKQGVTQSVILNGYPMYIRKGAYVDVPKPVADVLETKLKHRMSVENHPDRVKADGRVNLVSFGA